jgi:hypothetical protein
MQKRFPLNYKAIQQIKAEEYDRFFSQLSSYRLYMNHLGEIKWMTEEEARKQHEFFPHHRTAWERWKIFFNRNKSINLKKITGAEREIRIRLRRYLEQKYLGEVQARTQANIPDQWTFEIQDDDLINIPLTMDSFSSVQFWMRFVIPGISVVGLFLIIYFLFGRQTGELTGQLFIESTVEGGRVYLDNSIFLGYTNRIIENIPVGQHRISVLKDGYVSTPGHHTIEIFADSMVTHAVELNIASIDLMGYVKIITNQNNANVLIDNVNKGILTVNPILSLEEGDYDISLQKRGYIPLPAGKNIRIRSGDTSVVRFELIPLRGQDHRVSSGAAANIGSIDVSSSVKNATIFLNGIDSGEKTDYIFTQLPLGVYLLQLKKEGFQVQPDVLELNLTRKNPVGYASFDLIKSAEKVIITTSPVKGKIFVDRKLRDEGRFEGMLSVGDHTVSFGDVTGFKAPKAKSITVKPGLPLSIEVDYFPSLKMIAAIGNRGNLVTENCEVYMGYTFRERAFTASKEGGPAIEFNNKLNDYFLKLGYAFPYRNPKGNDAIKIVFDLPRNLEYDQNFTLKLYAASSKENYPMTISGKTEISIKFNKNILSYYYSPKYLEDLGGMEENEWDITSYVRSGENTLEIGTTDKNNTYYYIKRIEIYN